MSGPIATSWTQTPWKSTDRNEFVEEELHGPFLVSSLPIGTRVVIIRGLGMDVLWLKVSQCAIAKRSLISGPEFVDNGTCARLECYKRKATAADEKV